MIIHARRIVISAAALAAFSFHARAEEAASPTAAAELPPIIVEGATLEVKPVSKPKAKPAPVEVEVPAPPPVAKKASKKAAKSKAPKPAEAQSVATAGGHRWTSQTMRKARPPSQDAGESVAGIPAAKVGSAVSVVTGGRSESAASAQRGRCAAQPARCLRQPAGRSSRSSRSLRAARR